MTIPAIPGPQHPTAVTHRPGTVQNTQIWAHTGGTIVGGSFSRGVLLGDRQVVSGWLVPGAESLEPDDLDQAEPAGVRA
jgi:hypothetical protein